MFSDKESALSITDELYRSVVRDIDINPREYRIEIKSRNL
jgi:hypothetical protein